MRLVEGNVKLPHSLNWYDPFMATFVLVHGAWQTAGTWDLLSVLLRGRGHRVITPFLSGLDTGLGAHPTPLSPAVSLSQHIEDIVTVVSHSTAPVVLVGHSYAGMIISGVAERVAGQIDSLVYVDAFLPEDGQSVLDLLPAAVAAHLRQSARDHGDGWLLPGGAGELDFWGLAPGPARDFAQAHLSDFSLRCFEEPVRLPHNRKAQLPCRYVSCVARNYPAKGVFLPFAEKARANARRVLDLDCGHACHIELPAELAAFLAAP